jgi:hypothetical protein
MTAGVPEPRRGVADRTRAVLGLVLLVGAILAFCARPVLAPHDRSWSADARPLASYELIAGRLYHLSTVEGPIEGSRVPLSCTWRPVDATGAADVQPAVLASTPIEGERITHIVASFTAPATGRVQVTCAGQAAVFIDDAEGLGRDSGSVLLIAGIGLGLAGLCLAASGVRAARPVTRPKPGPAPASNVEGITVVSASSM